MKKYLFLLIVAIAMISCTKQEVYERETTSMITIYLNSQTITRAALVNDPKSAENTINSVTVVVAKATRPFNHCKDCITIGC